MNPERPKPAQAEPQDLEASVPQPAARPAREQTPAGVEPLTRPPGERSGATERTPALGVASTLEELAPLELAPDDEGERTVEALTADAFGDESSSPPASLSDPGFDVPTRQSDEAYRLRAQQERDSEGGDGFDGELTSVARVDGQKLDQAAARAERGARASSPGEVYYRDLVEEEISFSKATGYDKEGTAVVPLAELARREEERLRREEPDQAPAEEPTGETTAQRSIPVGEIIDVLRAARSVEEVAGVLVEIVSNLVPRVLLLWERRGRLYGFASRGMQLTEVRLLTIEMPKGLLQQMAAADLELETFQGPPNSDGMLQRFFELVGGVPAEVLLIPVQVTAEDRWLLYADNRDQPLPGLEVRLLEVIASRAGARADWLLDKQSIW